MAAVLYAVAPFVGRFFEEPAAVPLLRVVGLSLLIRGFTNVAVVTFQRNLTFDREFAFRGSGVLVDAVVAIAVAVAWRNAWALGVGTLAGALVEVLASFRLHPYRPRLSLALAPLHDLFRYGRWVTVSEALTVVAAQGAGLVVGKTLGLTALGIYDMAKRIPQLAIAEPGTKLSQVALPVYAKARGNARRLADGYWRIAGLAAVLALPATVGLWVVGEALVTVALGDLWLPVVQPLQIFVVSALCLSMARTARPVLLASGHPDVVFKLEVVRAAVLALVIYPLVLHFGVSGAAMAMLLASATLLVVSFAHLRRQLRPSARRVSQTFTPALVSSLLMGGAVLRSAPDRIVEILEQVFLAQQHHLSTTATCAGRRLAAAGSETKMRQVALDVVEKLRLNYTITLISGGEAGRYEIVMWDRPRDSYFSIRLRWTEETSDEHVAQAIEGQLRQRLSALDSSADSDFGERRPTHTYRAHA